MTSPSRTVEAVIARRTYPVPREMVFRAFADPEWLARWLSPSNDVSTTVIEFDFRPGGSYRLAFHFPGGRADMVVGKYVDVRTNERLVYTWTWEAPDPFAGVESLVTVDLSDSVDGTCVALTHELLPTEERRQIHDVGWQATLGQLAELLKLERGSRLFDDAASA